MNNPDSEAVKRAQMSSLATMFPGLAGMSESEMNLALNECAQAARREVMPLFYAGAIIAFAVAFVSLGLYSKYGSGYSIAAAVGSYVVLILWLRSVWRSQLRTELSRLYGKPPFRASEPG
jgi:hypothetical protein